MSDVQDQRSSGVEGFMEGAKAFELGAFEGLNMRSARSAIKDEEMSWCENWMPIAPGTLRTLYGKGATLLTASGKTIKYKFSFNIGTTSYHAVFYSDGTADQVTDGTGVKVAISTTPNTFYAGNGLPHCAQVGSSGILIVTPAQTNGYFAWDGTTLFSAGAFAPQWVSGVATIVLTAGTFTINSPTVTGIAPGTTGLVAGMGIASADTVAGTTIKSVDSATQITLSQNATASSTVGFTAQWLMPTGAFGSAIEVFQNRAFVAGSGTLRNIISFTAPNNLANFATANGGGSITNTNSFQRVGYTVLRQANGFLYVLSDSSIDVLSNILTSGSPPTTTFNLANTDPQVGTPWRDSLQPFGRGLVFANPNGIYVLLGGAAEKISDNIEVLFGSAAFPAGDLAPSAAVATIFGIRCYMLLIPIADPFTGATRNQLEMWNGKRWFQAAPETTPVIISTQEINSLMTAWASDGATLFPLFSTASATLTKKVQSKLWAGDGYMIYKQATRFYTELRDNTGGGAVVTVNVDSEVGSVVATSTSLAVINFLNASGGVIQFQNSSLQNINFTVPGTAVAGGDVDQIGKLLGFTASTLAPDITLTSLSMLYRDLGPFA